MEQWLRQKLVSGSWYFFDTSDNAGCWQNVDFGTLPRKAVECFKQGLMSHSRRSMEDNADDSLTCGALLKRFYRKRILVSGLEAT